MKTKKYSLVLITLTSLAFAASLIVSCGSVNYNQLSDASQIESVPSSNKAPVIDGLQLKSAKTLKEHAMSYYTSEKNGLHLPLNPQTNTTPGNQIKPKIPLRTGVVPQAYKMQARQTFGIRFNAANSVPIGRGSAWILDYQIKDFETYPLTWYFATNAHVIDNLSVENKYYPWLYNKNKPLATFEIISVSQSNLLPNGDADVSSSVNGYQYETEFLSANNVKPIFIGTDYLNTTPIDYVQSNVDKWFYYDKKINNHKTVRTPKQEYADFAVIEVTFENKQQAQKITHDYFNWDEKNKFSFNTTNPFSEQFQKVQTSHLGYIPLNYSSSTTIMINQNKDGSSTTNNRSSNLGTSPWYTIFENRNGIKDGLISMPWFGYEFSKSEYNTPYVTSGLLLSTDGSAMAGGASGSATIDQNGNILGAFFASDDTASTGLTQLLWSPEFHYGGVYGDYYLPAYNLISGTPKTHQNQSHSYLTQLRLIYHNNNIKTRLFPYGIHSNDFLFNNPK